MFRFMFMFMFMFRLVWVGFDQGWVLIVIVKVIVIVRR